MRISVVVNTYNRAPSLERTLRAFLRQTYEPFEVIVVNGPSTDGTADLLDRWSSVVRSVSCPVAHLGMSRNIGVEAAAGEVVAFIDDDAIPEPGWLADLAAGYEGEQVAGVGGIVFDHTGMRLQYRLSVCDRVGNPRFDIEPPLSAYLGPHADPFVYLQGTNASFRRRCLEEIGGFDEEIEFYLDETEVCLQLVDRGYELRPLPNAAVHHHYLPSHLRATRTVWVDPYPAIKNRFYFAFAHGRATRSHAEVLRVVMAWVEDVIGTARRLHESGELTDAQLATFLRRADQAVEDGMERGQAGERKSRRLASVHPDGFQAVETVQPAGPRLRVCFLTEEYPPGPVGGIGRFTVDLARGLAAAGHEVHVVTRSPDTNRVDVEDDVWVHRIAVQQRRVAAMAGSPLLGNLMQTAAFYHEVRRIHERIAVSVVCAPSWNALAFLCVLDGSFPTVVGLHTTLKTITGMLPSWQGRADIEALLRLEEATLRESRELHANSSATVRATEEQFPGTTSRAHLLPHGLVDPVQSELEPPTADGRVRVLFVGRLERRKGVDLLLSAAPELLRRHPDAEVVLVGADTAHTELGETYREWFQRQHAGEPELLRRVQFIGEIGDAEQIGRAHV
jgi:glycogen(starch) synthase